MPIWGGGTVALFSSSTAGTVPASGGGTSNFIRADGNWAAPSGGGGSTLTSVIAQNSTALTLISSQYTLSATPPVEGSASRILSLTIAATSNTQQITFDVSINHAHGAVASPPTFALFAGSTCIAIFGTSDGYSLADLAVTAFRFVYTPGNTTSTTYYLDGYPAATQDLYINRTNTVASPGTGICYSTMTATLTNT